MHNNSKSLFIVIPVHNRKHFTRDCLLSLRKQTFQNFTIIVIDDGSTDGTSEMIQKEFPEVVLLEGDGNLWWTAATNLGVKYALDHGANYIMTLNDDTIMTDDFIEKMIFWAEKKPGALLGGFALDATTKKPVYGGEIINWRAAESTFLLGIVDPMEQYGLHEVTHFPGRGLLISKEVFLRIGLFDERHFPQAAADYDFTHRAVRAGYKIFCNYDARLLIYSDASGDAQFRKKKNFKNYYNHLFGIKGGGNLGKFTRYTIRNCPLRYQPWFLVRGFIQRVFGYWLDYALEKIQNSLKKRVCK